MNSKLLIFVLSSLTFISLSAEILTRDENWMRSIQCGNEKLPFYSTNMAEFKVDSNSWLVKVSPEISTSRDHRTSIASFISPRHILTSAQVVAEPLFTDEEIWIMDGERVNLESGCGSSGRVLVDLMTRQGHSNSREVPEKYVMNLNITSLNCRDTPGDCETSVYTPVKAWIIGVCPAYKNFLYYAPLIIEVKESGPSFGCLADETVPEAEVGEEYHLYGLVYVTNNQKEHEHLEYDKSKFAGRFREKPEHLVMSAPNNKDNRGGPMVREVDGRQYIYGIRAGANQSREKDNRSIFFYEISTDLYATPICKVSGVCRVQPGEYTVPGTIEVPSTTTTTIPNSTTSSTSTALPKTTPTTTTTKTITSESPTLPVTAVTAPSSSSDPIYDQPPEREDELEKAPMDDDDDTDYHVDDDFLNGVKYWGFELFVVIVLFLWVL